MHEEIGGDSELEGGSCEGKARLLGVVLYPIGRHLPVGNSGLDNKKVCTYRLCISIRDHRSFQQSHNII
jgi:hypothetical protein